MKNVGQVRTIESSTFTNGIIHGNNTNEFTVDVDESTSPLFTFDRFLFRTDRRPRTTTAFPIDRPFTGTWTGSRGRCGGRHCSSESERQRQEQGLGSATTQDLDDVFYGGSMAPRHRLLSTCPDPVPARNRIRVHAVASSSVRPLRAPEGHMSMPDDALDRSA